MAAQPKEYSGVLVGWTVNVTGNRLMLRLECVDKPPPHDAADVAAHYIALNSQQAVQLGNFLFEISGHSKPPPRPGWLARLLMR